MDDVLEFDYLIVGGGAAGAVLARVLAEHTDSHVALLEAGPADEGRPEVVDFRRFSEVGAGPLARRIPTVAPAAEHRGFFYPTSRVLGGSTSQNTCIWFRPPASDFASWQAAGATGWSLDELEAHLAALEARIHVEEELPDEEGHRKLWQAAAENGYPSIDFSQPFDAGIGRYRMNKIGTQRRSSSVAFLHPLTSVPRNLAVFTETEVQKLIFAPGKVVAGVRSNRGEFRTRREVVLCAGALDTPKLLMLSGIGPASHLADHGIEVRADLAGVGAHLLDHPAACVNVSAPKPLTRAPVWNYAGVLFVRVEPAAVWPDMEIQLGPELFEKQTRSAGYPSAPDGFTAYMTVSRACSEGTVRLASDNIRDDPIVDFAYFSDPAGYDLNIMIGGIKKSRELFAARAIAGWVARELAPGTDARSDDELCQYVRATATTGYHAAGTCRMGAIKNPLSVVDSELRVIGASGLRIADASVFPTMVSVNIAATCMMIGHRAASLIGGRKSI